MRQSLGEFRCVKPSSVRFQNAWISDRTLCYLASGKPAIVEHTGPSRFLPDHAGLLRFTDFKTALKCLEAVSTDYRQHSRLARSIIHNSFDSDNLIKHILELARSPKL